MENFLELTHAIDDILNENKLLKIKQEFNKISAKYREESGGVTVVSTKDQVLSYLSGRMIETASVVDDVLNRVCQVTSFKCDVKTVLDIGSGTGSCLWAIDNFVKNTEVIALEKEPEMIKFAKQLNKNLSCAASYVQASVLSDEVKKLNSCDLVIESFMLNELSDIDRVKAVDFMLSKAKDYVIMIEPGTPKSYERMMIVREYVLSKGFNLVLPCMHSNECGLQNDYCNFSVRVSRTKTNRQIKGGTLNYEDEKYFYLVFRKENKREKNYSGVVLRKPIYRKGCVDLKLCLEDGCIKNKTITKSQKENYKKAKDLKHGDVVGL